MRFLPSSPRARGVVGSSLVAVACASAYLVFARGAAPDLPTAAVTRGDYTDIIETRGDIRPLRSIAITAPYQAGDLQILKLAPNGAAVKKGDVVAELDALSVQRTIQDKESELRQALSEKEQAAADARLTDNKSATTLMTSKHDVDRAKLDISAEDFVSKSDADRAKLTLGDAEQKLTENQTRDRAGHDTGSADAAMRDRKIAKIQADIDRAKASVASLRVLAPADGTVSIMDNYRNGSMMGASPQFREGDKIWPGAQIIELPDLTSVHLSSRIDETDRGQIKVGQTATIRVDAVPDHEYQATVADLSILARVDWSTGWPPTKNFDLTIDIRDPDDRLRPGMSGIARIAVGRLPNMLLVPAAAVFTVGGRPVVYRLVGRRFEMTPVDVVRRGRDQAAIKDGLNAGDRVALTRPDAPPKGSSK